MQAQVSLGGLSRRILVSGASGLIGRRVVADLRNAGNTVVRLVRGVSPAKDAVSWDPEGATLSPQSVSGFDVVIHLAGEPLAGRWTPEKKKRIFKSRVRGTSILAQALAQAEQPPEVFLSASGINYYGNTGDTIVDEDSPRGHSFLADGCELWEGASAVLPKATRVVTLRIGVVLSEEGGTLAMLLPLYRMGLGGTVAGGRGWVSWVSLDDVVCAMQYAIVHPDLSGPVNLVSPHPVTGKDLTRDLAAAVGRPAFLAVPAWVMRLAMGEMADETVLGSVRAMPTRLMESGFKFKDETLPAALIACGIHPRT